MTDSLSAKVAIPDHLWIRGRQLNLQDLVDRQLANPVVRNELRVRLHAARPFPHLAVEGWFNPVLLELVHEEFDQFAADDWKIIQGKHEKTHRSVTGSALGPASQTYFNLIHTGWFLDLVSYLIDVDHLIPDPLLYGGGLHETRAGGTFGIHRDFNRHHRNGLHNEAVFITYLNRDWDPAWGGALELWDPECKTKVTEIQPLFGRTLLMPHGMKSYHGHPEPLRTPEGRVRRSIAAYYYSNRDSVDALAQRKTSAFLFAGRMDAARRALHQVTPPVVTTLARKVRQAIGLGRPIKR